MRRLVYSPYVQSFIKSDYGVVDISPYIVSGSVNRKVNQVSSAQLTIRNPVQGGTNSLIWTEHSYTDKQGKSQVGPMFHPMDPIIIIMTRLAGHDVEVFTGYLDKAPYLQLYPGVCTLEASCTLKRLLYTQWDAALQFVRDFLQQFGWQLDGDSGLVNPSAETQKVKAYAGSVQGQFNDGSIGALLFAVLNFIGQWDESTIWIEALPSQIKDIVIKLYNQISGEVQQGQEVYESLLTQILGSSSQGSGAPGGSGSPTGTITNASKIVPAIVASANRWGVPPEMLVAIALIENNLQPTGCTSGSYAGTFQVQWSGGGSGRDSPPYGFGPWSTHVPSCSEANDVGLASNACAAAAAGFKSQYGNDMYQWAIHIQGVENNLAGQSSGYSQRSGWDGYVAQAKTLISQYGGGASTQANNSNTSLSPTQSAAQTVDSVGVAFSGKSPGGKQGNASDNSNGVINPIPGFTNLTFDKGIDGSAPTGSAILAPADCTLVNHQDDFYTGPSGAQPLMLFKFDKPISGAPTQYWYVSEQINPVTLTHGTHFNQGDTVATFASSGTGIEIGWGSASTNDMRYAPVEGHYNTQHVGWGWNFYNFFSIGTGTPQQAGPGPTGGGAGGGAGGNDPTAAAFATFINLPSIFSSAEALAFTGKRSFIADQPLFPFIEQLAQASMRNFMSMPNGNFFAFFPDYFGLFGRKAYWEIHDIEIIDCRIDLSDDPLVTHVAVAGDVTQFHGTIDVFDMLMTSGIFDIFDAITTGYVGNDPVEDMNLFSANPDKKLSKSEKKSSTKQAIDDKASALAFLQKYGARPYVEEAPMIRSPFFELFYAFQKFLLLWSKQFQTTIEITFMPELFPGGLIALPDHHLQLYVEEVVHSFDYQQGFTTTANVSSPSRLDGQTRKNISEGLARPAAFSGSAGKRTNTITPPSLPNKGGTF